MGERVNTVQVRSKRAWAQTLQKGPVGFVIFFKIYCNLVFDDFLRLYPRSTSIWTQVSERIFVKTVFSSYFELSHFP